MGCTETNLPDSIAGAQEIWTETNRADTDQINFDQLIIVFSVLSKSELSVEECNN